MKKLALALVASGGLLLGTASSALALPPNPVRQAARLHEAECANPQGRFTHGTYVSFVARGYPVDPVYPTDPIRCVEDDPFGDR